MSNGDRREREPIGVIGTGYVGLVTAAGFAELGSEVWCVDIDAEKVAPAAGGGDADLRAGPRGAARAQPRAAALLHRPQRRPRHGRACCSWPSARRPPTPATPTCRRCTRSSTRCPASESRALVMKSTVPAGTGASLLRTFAEQGKQVLSYVSCPEFLKEGTAVEDFMNPDRVVVGDQEGWAGDAVADAVRAARRAAGAHRRRQRGDDQARLPTPSWPPRSRSSTRSPTSARRPARTSSRWPAGSAWTTASGPSSCRPGSATAAAASPRTSSALKQLAGNSGYHFQLLTSVIEVNELQKRRVIAKLQRHLGSLAGRRVALLGLAFKPDTDDMRGGLLAGADRALAGRRGHRQRL